MIWGCLYNNYVQYFEWLTWYTGYTKNLATFFLYNDVFKFYLIHVYRDVKDPVLTWFQTFLCFTNPPFQTLNALKSTSFQAFKIVFRLLTDALTPLFTWIKFSDIDLQLHIIILIWGSAGHINFKREIVMISGCFYNNWLCTLFWVAHLIYRLHKESSNFHLVYDVFKFYLIHVYRDVKDPVLTWVQTFLCFTNPLFRLLMLWKAHLFKHFKLF